MQVYHKHLPPDSLASCSFWFITPNNAHYEAGKCSYTCSTNEQLKPNILKVLVSTTPFREK